MVAAKADRFVEFVPQRRRRWLRVVYTHHRPRRSGYRRGGIRSYYLTNAYHILLYHNIILCVILSQKHAGVCVTGVWWMSWKQQQQQQFGVMLWWNQRGLDQDTHARVAENKK